MTLLKGLRRSTAWIVAAAMLLGTVAETSAFPISAPPQGQSIGGVNIEKVFWCRWRCGPGWGWRGGRWGYWGPGPLVAGGVVAGAVITGAYAGPGPCWRRVYGPRLGWHWQRVC